MIKILANDGINPDGKLLLEEANYIVDTEKVEQNKLPEVLPEYDVLIVRSATQVRKDLIDICPKLKIIARAGVGLDNIDVDYAIQKGIKVINTPGASSHSVAELTFAHLFSLTRFLHDSNKKMSSKGNTTFKKLKKSYSKGMEITGKTLGIIGFGRIGQEVARIGLGLGMNVIPVDLVLDEAIIDIELFNNDDFSINVKVRTEEFDYVLQRSDFITVHVPFSGGKSAIGREEISKMKDGVILINCARGGVVDEEALLEALNSGKVAGAGLDVFINEPTPRQDLLKHPNVSASPHIGASTLEAQARIGLELADKIIDFFEN